MTSYTCLILFLSVSGKRMLAKLNAFDLVVTVARCSTFSAILVQQSVPFAQAPVALGLLVLMQFSLAWASVRSARFADAGRSEPRLPLRHGTPCRGALRAERITEPELLSAVRACGGRGILQRPRP